MVLKTYDGLVDMGYKRHYRVHHGKNEFSKKTREDKESYKWDREFLGDSKSGGYLSSEE